VPLTEEVVVTGLDTPKSCGRSQFVVRHLTH
jgi:hypothetical protein